MDPASRPSPGRRPRPVWVWAALALLPWSWFLVRDLWGPLDGFAVALPLLGLGAVLAGVFGTLRWGRLLPVLAGLSALAVAVVAVVEPRLPYTTAAPARPVRIASANVLDSNEQPRAAALAILARQADVTVAVEMPEGFPALMQRLGGYRFRATHGALGLWADGPVTVLGTPPQLSGARVLRARVETPELTLVVYVVHARNPLYEATFSDQRSFAARLVNAVTREVEPTVVVGDLNLSDRTDGYRILESSFHDAMRAGSWAGNTYVHGVWRTLLLRIDHLFVPESWCAAAPGSFSIPGSDHDGIEATVGPCPT